MNSVFHPSRKNPFLNPQLPQSHYAPSPSKEILDKSVTLTPQKLKHRHEYSLPPEVYTPEQYSILEENSPFNKPPLPTHENNDAVLNLQQILSDVETWDSVKFCEKWSSKIFEVKEDTSTRKVFDKPHGPLSSTIKSETSKLLVRTMKDKPTRIQTSFASDQNSSADYDRTSNIQQRLDRFRFGAPKAPEKRKAGKSKQSTSSGVSINHLRSLNKSQSSSPNRSSKVMSQSPMKENSLRIQNHGKISISETNKTSVQDQDTVPKPPLPPPSLETTDVIDTSLSSLNSRLDRLIQQSSSVALSPLSTCKSTLDRSSASILKVSSDSTTLSSDFPSIQKAPELCDNEAPRKMLWQKDFSSPLLKQSAATPKENDILYQWRLKRKLEEAREHIESNQGIFYNRERPPSKAERPFSAEASRVLQDSTSVSGIRSNPITPKKQNRTLYQPASQYFPPLGRHFYQTSCGCPCVHQLPHVTGPEQVPEKQDAAVGVTEKVSIETQTGRSLVFSDDACSNNPISEQGGLSDENEAKPTCAPVNTFPHTSTPSSTVSFHRVKIIEAEAENSPQPAKGSSQAQNLSPLSHKTDVTTLWSSTDHKRMEGSQSPVSSVPSSHQRLGSDTEPCSPTADVVKEVVGSHLFNTTRSSSTTSAVSRLKDRKKSHDQKSKPRLQKDDSLNGSYTESSSSDKKKVPKSDNRSPNPVENNQGSETHAKSPISEHCSSHDDSNNQAGQNVSKMPPISPMKPLSPVEELHCTGEADETESDNSMEDDDEFDFDPAEFFDKILEDVMGNQFGLTDKKILKELQTQKNHILEEFRQIADEIENCDTSDL